MARVFTAFAVPASAGIHAASWQWGVSSKINHFAIRRLSFAETTTVCNLLHRLHLYVELVKNEKTSRERRTRLRTSQQLSASLCDFDSDVGKRPELGRCDWPWICRRGARKRGVEKSVGSERTRKKKQGFDSDGGCVPLLGIFRAPATTHPLQTPTEFLTANHHAHGDAVLLAKEGAKRRNNACVGGLVFFWHARKICCLCANEICCCPHRLNRPADLGVADSSQDLLLSLSECPQN